MYITININTTRTFVGGFSDLTLSSQVFLEEFPTESLYGTNEEKIYSVIVAKTKLEDIKGIGIAYTGEIKNSGEIINVAFRIADHNGKNIIDDIKQRFPGIFVGMENNAVCSGLAEMVFGKAQNYNTLGAIYLSSGIGGAFIKKIEKDYNIFQAEIGHQIIELNGRPCDQTCGQRGCLEAYVGAESIKKRFLLDQTHLSDLRIWEELVEYMAIGIANMYNMFFPGIITISGRSIKEVDYIEKKIIDEVYLRLNMQDTTKLTIKISDFNEKSPTYGALALLKMHEDNENIVTVE